MAKQPANLLIRLLLTFGFLASVILGAPISSCAQTPHPSTCNQFMIYHPKIDQSNGLFFRDIALSATRSQAQVAHQLVSALALSSSDEKSKPAWDDCVDLYEDTVYLLDQILINSNGDHDDVQTHLSAALANVETCNTGFLDLNVSSHLHSFPRLLGDLAKLLSNALAINKASQANTKTTSSTTTIFKHLLPGRGRRLLADGSFPPWVSSNDRRLLQESSGGSIANLVVAKDGSGEFTSITEALNSPRLKSGTSGGNRFVVYVKSGVYNENVVVKRSMKNLVLIGDGIGATIVTGDHNVQQGTTTFRSATFAVTGSGFMARDMTFQNTAGPDKHQAVALRSGADFSVFYRCRFVGYQDTLYVYHMRQFYRDCEIYGTVDFIFGDAAVVFQNCNIFVRRPMGNQFNTVTAQARKDPNENTGIVIHNCHITAASDLKPVQASFKTYLGRPWQQYSRTVIIKSVLDDLINPQGWLPWSGSFALSTLYYAEYLNTGGGASTGGRVRWPGYHILTNPVDAGRFTVGNFLVGDRWIPTDVPFTAGL